MKNILLLLTSYLIVQIAYSQDKESQDIKKGENCEIPKSTRDLDNVEEETINCFPKVSFDFRYRNSITIPKKLKPGDFYQVVVSNINLNDYKVVVEGTDTIFSSPLSFPTFGSIDLSSLQNIISSHIRRKR